MGPGILISGFNGEIKSVGCLKWHLWRHLEHGAGAHNSTKVSLAREMAQQKYKAIKVNPLIERFLYTQYDMQHGGQQGKHCISSGISFVLM